MRKGFVIVSIAALALLAFAVVSAEEESVAAKTHDLVAKVIAVDQQAQTLTFEVNGEKHTAPVLEEAQEVLAKIAAGDEVTLTCQDNEKGEHEGIKAIKTS